MQYRNRIALAAWMTVVAWALPAGAQTFTKITDPNNPIVSGTSSNYSGAAWVDYDGDGDLDLFVSNNFLYRNEGDGVFTAVAGGIGNNIASATGNGNTWGDYDNDGDLDVYNCSGNSFLYRNNGSGSFTRITTGDIGNGFAARGWSCAWGDYDRDGNLDLAITHPAGFVPGGSTTNHLFHNDGPPNYTFTRITTGPIVTGLSSYTVGSWSDYDGDGDLDYFVGAGPASTVLQPDFLYRNLLTESGSATFERIGESPIATDQQDGQLWNWIDVDNDGDLDGYLTNWGGSFGGMRNRMYRNEGDIFTSIQFGAHVTDSLVSLSSVWADFDNDGDLDCFVANDSGQPDRFYRNSGFGTFSSVFNPLNESLTHRGAAAGDYDDDGDIDLYVDGPAGARSLFRNDTTGVRHWIKVRLVGETSNRSGIGAKVRVRATIGTRQVWQMREVSAQNTFNGHNELNPHFGLLNATVVERLVIEWPGGAHQSLANVPVDQWVEVGESGIAPPIPDGHTVPGQPLTAALEGGDVRVSWDSEACPADSVHLYYGAIGDYGTFSGAECGLPSTGTALVDLPESVWFLVAATDGVATDGSYGRDGLGDERMIAGSDLVCPGTAMHVINDTCL